MAALPAPVAPARPRAYAVVLNPGSGAGESAARMDTIRAAFARAGRPHELLPVTEAAALPAVTQRAIALARAQGGAVVAAGGDGTLNAVVQAVLPTGLPLGVLPQGTFNYFARAHQLPLELPAALAALLAGEPTAVSVGEVNGRVFLVNASVGLYPALIERREALAQRIGRRRLTALLAALDVVLRGPAPQEVTLALHEIRRSVRTTLLFVGNDRAQLTRVGVDAAERLDDAHLAAVVVRPLGRAALLALLARAALGRLGQAPAVESFAFEQLTVAPHRPWWARAARAVPRARVALDGEVLRLPAPLVFRRSPQPLWLLRPPPGSAPAAWT